MTDFLIFAGSFCGAALLMLVAWWKVSRSVAAENAIVLEEWETT